MVLRASVGGFFFIFFSCLSSVAQSQNLFTDLVTFPKYPPSLLTLNATLEEEEKRKMVSIVHRIYRAQDYGEIADKALPENKAGAILFVEGLKENLDNIEKVIRKEILFKFLVAAVTIDRNEIFLMRRKISERFRFNTTGEIFGDFERSVPTMYEVLLNVSETLYMTLGDIDPGTPVKYLEETTLGEEQLDVLADTFSVVSPELALILCTTIVQSLNRITDEELSEIRLIPAEMIVPSAYEWPESLGPLNHSAVYFFAEKFSERTQAILSEKIADVKRQVAIEFDEDQQAEFVERVDVLNLRIRRFLVQFAIVSFVEIIQQLDDYDLMLLHRYVTRKASYLNHQEIFNELHDYAPNLQHALTELEQILDALFAERLQVALERIDHSWSTVQKHTLREEAASDLTPEVFDQSELVNELWNIESPAVYRAYHTMTTRYHRLLLRSMRRDTPTIYQSIAPFHLLMEAKRKRFKKDAEYQMLIEILRAESIRMFVTRLVGPRVRDRFGETVEDFFGRNFHATIIFRSQPPLVLDHMTQAFRGLTSEQLQIMSSVPVY